MARIARLTRVQNKMSDEVRLSGWSSAGDVLQHTLKHILPLSIQDTCPRLQVLRPQEVGHGQGLGVCWLTRLHGDLVCLLLSLLLGRGRFSLLSLLLLSRWRSLALLLCFHLLLMRLERPHPQLRNVLLGR